MGSISNGIFQNINNISCPNGKLKKKNIYSIYELTICIGNNTDSQLNWMKQNKKFHKYSFEYILSQLDVIFFNKKKKLLFILALVVFFHFIFYLNDVYFFQKKHWSSIYYHYSYNENSWCLDMNDCSIRFFKWMFHYNIFCLKYFFYVCWCFFFFFFFFPLQK